MALTWREVTAPKLDTRDLAYAGQTIGASFDKLGDMFIKRELDARTKATDEAKAQYLMETDPAKLAASIAGLAAMPRGPNQRVNIAEVLEGAHGHRGRLIQAADANEDMLNKQALGKHGLTIEALSKAALTGDTQAEATLRANAEADPLFSRALAQTFKDVTGFRDDYTDNKHQTAVLGETARGNTLQYEIGKAQVGVQRQRLAMDQAERAREQAERDAAKKLGTEAVGWTERFLSHPNMRQMTPDQALIELKKTDTWAKMSPERRGVIGQLIKPRAEELQALPEQYALPGRSDYGNLKVIGDQLAGKADAAIGMVQRDAMRNNPGAYFIGLAQDKKFAGATPATVAAAYDKLGYNFTNNQGFTKGYLDKLMNGPEGLPPAVVMAALTSSIHEPSYGSGGKFMDLLGTLTDAYYNQNETRKTQSAIATESGKFTSLTARKETLLEQARIEQATERKVSAKTKAELARVEKDLERAVSIYNTAKEVKLGR